MALSAIVDWRRRNRAADSRSCLGVSNPAIHSTNGPSAFLIAARGVREVQAGAACTWSRTRLARMAPVSSSARFRFNSATFGATVPFHNSECAGLRTCEALGTDMGPDNVLDPISFWRRQWEQYPLTARTPKPSLRFHQRSASGPDRRLNCRQRTPHQKSTVSRSRMNLASQAPSGGIVGNSGSHFAVLFGIAINFGFGLSSNASFRIFVSRACRAGTQSDSALGPSPRCSQVVPRHLVPSRPAFAKVSGRMCGGTGAASV